MRSRRTGLAGFLAIALCLSCGRETPAVLPAVAPAVPPATLRTPATEPPPAETPRAAPPELPKLVSDQWYRTLHDGQPSGWRHVRWTRTTYEGKPAIHDRTEGFSSTTRRMGNEEDTFEARDFSDLDRTEDGLLLRVETHGVQGERLSDSTAVWTGKGYELTSRVAGLEEKHSVACDAPCPVDSEAFLSAKLQRGEVAVGQVWEYRSPNYLARRLDTVTLTVDAQEALKLPAGEFECFRVAERVAGVPGDATWWLDRSGVVRKLRTGRTQVIASTEARARDLRDGGARFSITVAADPQMARCTSLDRAVVEVTLAPRDGAEMPDFPATPFSHELSREGNVIRVELTSHDEPADAVALPVADPALAKHLERTNLFSTGAPRVREALAEAAGDEKDARLVVKRTLRYVFVTLRKESGPIPEPTAVEILEEGRGDCSEHCALFVTLCRAAGIPARRLSGYAQVGEMWGAHSFAEVWLGRWVGCDPTTNEYGTRARYLAFGWEDDPDSFPGIVSSRVSGRMRIRTEAFTEGGRTWRSESFENPTDREDVLSGLSFAEPPEGWSAGIGAPGQGHVAGPGVSADVSVVAGFGDLPCDVLSRSMMRGSKTARFAGREALRDDVLVRGRLTVQLMVPYRRRMLSVRMRTENPGGVDAALATLATLLAPTFEP